MPSRRLLTLAAASALALGCMNEVEVTRTTARPPTMQLSATTLAFTALTSGGNPAARTVTVTNFGTGTLAVPVATVGYTSGAGWLAATVSGTAVPFTVTVQAALGALAVGTYRATVSLASAGASNSPRTIEVTLVVRDPRPPEMVLSASTLGFAGAVGLPSPAAKTVTVTNGGELPLGVPAVGVAYDSTDPARTGWLSATVSGSAPPYLVTVRATTGALAAGTYSGSVDLTSAPAPPVSVVVTFTVSAPRTVTVSRLVTFWTEAGAGTPAADPNVQSVALRQDDGAGGLTSIPATPGATAGTWTASAGPGEYWAVVTFGDQTQSWVRASAAALDLGDDVAGRSDRVAATATTTATLGLRALEPWDQLSDALGLASYGAQGVAVLSGSTQPPLPLADGEVDLLGFAFDWRSAVGPLLAASDELWLTQLRLRQNTAGTLFYEETRTWSRLTGVAMTDGVPVALAAPDAQFVTGAGQLLLDWRRSEFEAALPPSSSTSQTAHQVGVFGIPARLEAPSPFGSAAVPLLVTFSPPTTARDPDFSAGTLAYGRFLPAAWNEVFTATLAVEVTRAAPGATGGAPGLRDQVLRNDAIAAAPNPVVPLVGGAQTPTIDGLDALTTRTGLSTTPTLAWSAPATGTASSYLVELQRLSASGTATVAAPVALFVLSGTSLTIPAGLLQAGQTYLARLVARSNPGDAAGNTPFRVGVPYGEASYWTATFTTAP